METLKEYEIGIEAIELATRNGLKFIPSGSDLSITKQMPEMQGYDKESAKLVVDMLRNDTQKKGIKAITSDPEAIRKTLCEGQEAMSQAFDHADVLRDLFDRLEKAYRIVHPDIKECIHGEKGCPDGAIVNCTACSGVSYAS